MATPRRELRTKNLSCKVTATMEKFVIDLCENEEISTSEYLYRLIKADLAKSKRRKKN